MTAPGSGANSLPAWTERFGMIAVRMACVSAALMVQAPTRADAEALVATYAFRWAGLEVGELEAVLSQDARRYRASWRGRTLGLIGSLFPFTSEGQSEGRREGGRYLSERYAGRSRSDEGGSTWRVAFGPDGRATRVEVPAEQMAERGPVPEALRTAPDPAALLLGALAIAGPGAALTGTSFDGKRATSFVLACDDERSGGGRPDGAELRCTIRGKLLAGGAHGWRSRSRGDERAPIEVWLRPGLGPEGSWWPIRLEAPLRVGTVEMRLVRTEQRAHIGG